MLLEDKNMNMHKNQDNRYFRLTSFYTACFLFAKGLELVNIEDDPTNPRRSQFVFKDTSERESLMHVFSFAKENASEVLIDPRRFITAIKQLKDKLYQGQF